MSTSERQFIVQTPDGTEYGPVEQGTLQEWAEQGRLTADCRVRSTLVPRWNLAGEVPFLKGRVKPPQSEAPRAPGMLDKLGVSSAASTPAEAHRALHRAGRFEYTPASPGLRVGAAAIDLALIALYGAAAFGLAGRVLVPISGPHGAFYLGLMAWYTGSLLYVTLAFGLRAQTLGQWYWGLMVVHENGGEVFLGRAFLLALGTGAFGVLSPLLAFILPGKRGLAEILTATRIVRTRFLRD